ncbi:MAG: hypothetical protein WBV94_09135 [Blastocatellia bacterium]
MKRFCFVLALFVAMLAATLLFATGSINAKENNPLKLITGADLDHSFVQGATVKYQLTDEEIQGAPLFYSNGTIVRRFNAVIIVDYIPIDARTDERGRRLFRVRVDRPDFLGGPFEKDAAFDSGRSPGTIDSIQPGDLVH